jgi:RecA/RadA recombinase
MAEEKISLAAKLKKVAKDLSEHIDILEDSDYNKIPYFISAPTVILNLGLTARWNGGIPAGRLTMFAGEKSSTKTLNALHIANEFQRMFNDGVIIYIDAEHALTDVDDLKAFGIDPKRVLYIPLATIESDDKDMSLLYQMSNILKELDKDDKVLILLDSVGILKTARTDENALIGKNVTDMKVVQDKKRFLSILNDYCGLKRFPAVVINHTYTSVGSFIPTQAVAGGSINYIPSITIQITSKAKLKGGSDGIWESGDDGKEIVGHAFTFQVEKGRMSREKSKGTFMLHQKHGFLKYSGLLDYALEYGLLEELKEGRSTVYKIKGLKEEVLALKKSIYLPEFYGFWETLFKETNFGELLSKDWSYGL